MDIRGAEQETPLYLQVRETILREISTEYKVGEKIPTEYELVSRFGVHRGTVRKAISTLAHDGILRRVPGKGTFIARPPDEERRFPGRIWNIAVCLPTNTGDLMFNPFYSQVIDAIITGYEDCTNITIHRLDQEFSTTDRVLERIEKNGTNGVVIVGRISDEVVCRFKHPSIPIVLGDMAVSDDSVDAVVTNNVDAAFQAVEYLIGLGHTKIAAIAGPADDRNCCLRLKGYRLALASGRIDADESLIVRSDHMNRRGGYDAMEALLNAGKPFTAVVAANDVVAFGAMAAARMRGASIPADISVMGFDDIEASAHSLPPLTTMHVDKHQMGLMIVERMVSRLSRYYLPPQEIQLSAKLLERESCQPVAS